MGISKLDTIRAVVRTGVEAFATGFRARHEAEVDNPNGTINMKIHNVFIEALGPEIQYYTTLVRSLDSPLGNALEGIGINIARLSFRVERGDEAEAQTVRSEPDPWHWENGPFERSEQRGESYDLYRSAHT